MGKEKRSFAIIGLGAFGGTVAVELARYGNNVLGIDMDERSVAQMAPLVQALQAEAGIASAVCVSAQHREMLDSVMQIFRLTAQYDLNIMQKQQTLSSITTRALLGMEQALQEAQPDLVLVHGDTSTTFAGALAALARLGLVGREDLPCRYLSQGQKRRVALARLVHERRALWILDEPYVALDAAAIELVASLIVAHLQRGGLVVLTTHQAVELAAGTIRELRLD